MDIFVISVVASSLDMQGPLFLQEPPHRVEFSNSSGGRIECTAHGSPPPTIEWLVTGSGGGSGDGGALGGLGGGGGEPAHVIPEIRIPHANGTLYFPPFTADRYRHDVHSATYRCRLRSSLGMVLSREVQVRAGNYLLSLFIF